ncbi:MULTISPECIES: hypothetical protein [Bacillus]|uniref:Uncharacterized protein n=2 Tax=Bacillus mojavensis subgroup TaxID=653388 RepID=A0A9Q4EJ40_9BACI|nr:MULTISPECIES: hypothetical protein [Bacillus]MBV7318347.1 hypothetical protein [Halalkalibacterium halodurans]MBJ7572255.1 hypothetical protein [Bacillus halotolerans]MBL4965892.1 hypothetical protein [Bacillus halotolerans]MBL4969594.1 hypothetical protein [Bacillus halotolerans]MBL4973656.1 hypothetical protein [Bacillus halotolerans]
MIEKQLFFPEISCSFFLASVDFQPGRTFYVLLLGEHIQWV